MLKPCSPLHASGKKCCRSCSVLSRLADRRQSGGRCQGEGRQEASVFGFAELDYGWARILSSTLPR
uniref:Uncharacterized protein n=1 Tax=Arundo donax TaxID=35708 RepID=A0A0A9A1J0_ARUDO